MEIKNTLPAIEQVKFTVEALPEDIPIQGNVIVSDDPKFDAEVENDIAERLKSDIWAWCRVKVTATWEGLEGADYLGCCSYLSEESFMKGSTTYPEMRERAYDELITKLKDLGDKQ